MTGEFFSIKSKSVVCSWLSPADFRPFWGCLGRKRALQRLKPLVEVVFRPFWGCLGRKSALQRLKPLVEVVFRPLRGLFRTKKCFATAQASRRSGFSSVTGAVWDEKFIMKNKILCGKINKYNFVD